MERQLLVINSFYRVQLKLPYPLSTTATDVFKKHFVIFGENWKIKEISVWKKRWLILRAQTKNGPVRLEKFEDECAALMNGKCRTFILTDTLNLYRVPDIEKKHAIHIDVDQYESIQFCLESEGEANLWVKKIEGEIAEAHNSKNSFSVYILKNPKVPIQGDCTLELTSDSIRLLNHRDQEIVAWPLNKLRRYAVERHLFKIEAGRSCPTGEGEFIFETEEAQEIYDRIHNLTKTLAMTHRMNDMKINQENKSNNKRQNEKYDYSSKSKASYSVERKKDPRSLCDLSTDRSYRNRKNDYGSGRTPNNNADPPHVKSSSSTTGTDDDDGDCYEVVPERRRDR